MEFEWDATKDSINIAKHRISLGGAARLDWLKAKVAPDLHKNYGEVRELAYARIGTRLYVCAFTTRSKRYRIISLRKANKGETIIYG